MTFSASDLVRGQDNLDRMKREIETTYRLCLTHLSADEFRARRGDLATASVHLNKGSFEAEWEIFMRSEHPVEGPQYTIFAWVNGVMWLSGQTTRGMRLNPKMTLALHGTLSVFIDCMLKEFPSLEQRLAPYFKAAEVSF